MLLQVGIIIHWVPLGVSWTAGGTPVRKPTLTLRRHHHCVPESCEVAIIFFAKSWWGRGKIWKDQAVNILNYRRSDHEARVYLSQRNEI